jgi:hypothetical protein
VLRSPEFKPTSVVEVETEWSRSLKASRAAHYLPDHIRMDDVRAAIELGGRCLALLLLIHFRRAVTGHEAVTLPSGFLAEFGIDKSAKLRGLQRLEEAKLINVERDIGHTAVIKLRAKKRNWKSVPAPTARRRWENRPN